MELAPANLNPFETNRLLQDLAAYYAGTRQWPRDALRAQHLATRLITGESNGTLWLREPDSATAVAVWDTIPTAGLRISDLHFDVGSRNPGDFTMFSEQFSSMAEPDGGLFAITDTIAGVTPHFLRTLLEPIGFTHVSRRLLSTVISGTAPLDGRELASGKLVEVGIDHLEKLASLHAKVHSGRRDGVFAGNPLDIGEDGRKKLADIFMNLDASGEGLRHHPWGCLGIEDHGDLVAAILSREDMLAPKEKGWILDVLVHPEHGAEGLDQRLLGYYLNEALRHGLKEISVDVPEGDPVIGTYERAGMKVPPGQAGERKGLWVRTEAAKSLGLS